MQHRITKQEAVHLTQLVTSLQPGWDNNEFLQQLADVRTQHDFPAFMAQLTRCALDGTLIEEALAPVVPHVCPVSVVEHTSQQIDQQEAWLNGAAVSVVNEDDPTKSVLLRKRKPESEIVRPPSDDPTHWRNRFAADIERGAQQRRDDLMKARAEQLPAQTSDTQPATAAAAHQQSVPDQPDIAPELSQPVPNQQAYSWGPDDYEDYHDR